VLVYGRLVGLCTVHVYIGPVGRSMHLHVVVYNEDMTWWWMVTLCARVGVVFHSSSPNCLALSSASCVLSNTSVRLSVVSRNSLGLRCAASYQQLISILSVCHASLSDRQFL